MRCILPVARARSPAAHAQTITSPLSSRPATCHKPVVTTRNSSTSNLSAGTVVQIAGSRFRVTRFLGEGNFGKVWAAESCNAGQTVAIKEVVGSTEYALQNVQLEADLLRELGDEGMTIPSLVESEIQFLGSDGRWRARMAMSHVPGEILSEALETHRFRVPQGHNRYKCLIHASCFVRAFLIQLGPTLARISERVYHRDAHARNILADYDGSSEPQFRLIDFGLAVNSKLWREGRWKGRGAAGDTRYWPVSEWVMFLFGPAGVEAHEPLLIEYQTRLDIHSVGITALQLLVELSVPAHQQRASDSSESGMLTPKHSAREDQLLTTLDLLRGSWASYWAFATRCWQRILKAYAERGNAEDVKDEFAYGGVHERIAGHLLELREGLERLRLLCYEAQLPPSARSNPAMLSGEAEELGCCRFLGLVEALLLMIGCGTSTACPPLWQSLQDILGRDTDSDGRDAPKRGRGPSELPSFGEFAPSPCASRGVKPMERLSFSPPPLASRAVKPPVVRCGSMSPSLAAHRRDKRPELQSASSPPPPTTGLKVPEVPHVYIIKPPQHGTSGSLTPRPSTSRGSKLEDMTPQPQLPNAVKQQPSNSGISLGLGLFDRRCSRSASCLQPPHAGGDCSPQGGRSPTALSSRGSPTSGGLSAKVAWPGGKGQHPRGGSQGQGRGASASCCAAPMKASSLALWLAPQRLPCGSAALLAACR